MDQLNAIQTHNVIITPTDMVSSMNGKLDSMPLSHQRDICVMARQRDVRGTGARRTS